MKNLEISVVAPAYNEEGSIVEFVEKVDQILVKLNKTHEVIIVDDASTDRTLFLLDQLKKKYSSLRVIKNRKNLGLTSSSWTGFNSAKGDIIVFLPSDLESDPQKDIPALLSALDQNTDLVVGWRHNKRQGFIKTLISIIFNWLSSKMFHIKIHDLGWIKAFRREIIYHIEPLRSDWHRFFAILAAYEGYKVKEIKTEYHPRKAGKSTFGRFGLKRLIGGFFDLIVIKFNLSFSKRPMFIFGAMGLILFMVGLLGSLYLLIVKIIDGMIGNRMPLMFLVTLLLILGIQFFALGFIAELLVSSKQQIKK